MTTLRELRKLASSIGIKKYSRLTKGACLLPNESFKKEQVFLRKVVFFMSCEFT